MVGEREGDGGDVGREEMVGERERLWWERERERERERRAYLCSLF